MAFLSKTQTSGFAACLIAAQAVILTATALVFAMLAPANGAVLAVPLGGHGVARLIGSDTRLIGQGRLPESLVLAGAHPSFWTALSRDGILILPAFPALCGTISRQERTS